MKRVLGWGVIAGLLVLLASASGLLETPSLRAYNLLFSLRGAERPSSPIVIVTIDEDSFDELDASWPWPRAVHGELLDILSRGKPLVIGFDLIFSEPSARGVEDDAAFSAAIRRAGNVVLAAAPSETMTPFGPKQDMNLPLPMLRDGAAGFGAITYPIDPDANVRRAEPAGSFVTALYRMATKAGLAAEPAPGLQSADSFLINFRGGPGTYPQIPYYRLLRGEIPSDAVKDKIVLIGATTPLLHDVFAAPFAAQGNMPGVELQANALETVLRGNALREVPRPLTAMLVLLTACGGVWISTAFRPLAASLFTAATFAAFTGLAVLLLTLNISVDIAGPTLALGLGYFGATVDAYVREQRQSRRLSRFFSPAVLKAVVRAKNDQSLGSARRRLTVLFCDIRGFTAMSERLPPEEVAELLGEYLTDLTAVVFKHGGTVDKYVGDCIMALYNVPFEHPDHARQAVRTAIEFQERTRALSERWRARTGVELANGVGICTGEAVVGALGSRQRLEYTAIGDTVNLAARLETLTKEFDSPIIVSESTYALLGDEFPAKPLGNVTVKGKEESVSIYAITTPGTQKQKAATMSSI